MTPTDQGRDQGEDPGWLEWQEPAAHPGEDNGESAPDAAEVTTGSGVRGDDGPWLRHDLPDTTAVPDIEEHDRTGEARRDPSWLAPEVDVAPVRPTPQEASDTGVAPALVDDPTALGTPAAAQDGAYAVPSRRREGAAAGAAVPVVPAGAGNTEVLVPVDTNPAQHPPRAASTPVDAAAPEPARPGRGEARGHKPAGKAGHAKDSREPQSGIALFGAAVKEFAIVVGMALVLSFIVKTWLLQAFYIPSGSMENTLQINDRVIVSKLTPGPIDLKRGDIVVFADPGDWVGGSAVNEKRGTVGTVVRDTLIFVGLLPDPAENHLIKRVIGLPGDHVVCCDEGGRLTINGQPIKEPYIHPGDAASEKSFDITVPPGRVWVMGDHRSDSSDSRYHDGPAEDGSSGSVDERLIVGRAIALVWPLDHMTWLSNPTATFAKVPAPATEESGQPVPVPSGSGAGQGDGTKGGGGELPGGDDDEAPAPVGAGALLTRPGGD